MNDDILNTIETLSARIALKEDEVNRQKKLVNELCGEAGIAVRYPSITEAGTSVSALRSDQFYGQTLTAAIRSYLERRKSANLGAASVGEIYKAIKAGGYKFDTKSEDNAKTSVGNALRKTSSIFHRLPNGEFGLLVWYPSAKALPEADAPAKTKAKSGKKAKTDKPVSANPPKTASLAVTNGEIRDVILAQTLDFTASDIETAIKTKFPSKKLPKTKIPTVLFLLKQKGLIKEVSARTGKKGAVYTKG
jgi:hypothetical protein